MNEDKTQTTYFSRGRRPVEAYLTLNGQNIPFAKHAKYLGAIFDRKISWRLDTEAIEANAFKTFLSVYLPLKSERLKTNIKQPLTLHKVLSRSIMTCLPRLGFAAHTNLLKSQRLQNKVLRTN
jgi:hypothetical protein